MKYGEEARAASIFRKPGLAIKAREQFERAVQIDPDFLDARFALIEYDMRAPAFLGGSEAKAITQANEIRKRNPIEGHRAFAMIDLVQKKTELARKEYVAAVTEQPQYMRGWFEIGHIDATTGAHLDEGEDALRKYIAHEPAADDPPLYRAHYFLGLILERQGKKAEAKENYAKSLTANPNQKDVAEALRRVS